MEKKDGCDEVLLSLCVSNRAAANCEWRLGTPRLTRVPDAGAVSLLQETSSRTSSAGQSRPCSCLGDIFSVSVLNLQ